MIEHQKLAIQALENMRGDDLFRARSAFRCMTPAEMQKEDGQSGKTRAQALAEYEAHERKVNDAIEWVKGAK